MGYILIVRNPRNGKLIAVREADDNDNIAEFKTKAEAIKAAENTTACKAWTYGVFEVGLHGG